MAGFSQGGGVGLAAANWIVDGEPGMDVFAMDVARFGPFANSAYVLEKTRENYRRRFILPSPNEELGAARPLATTPIYEQFAAAGAVFGVAAGWEVPLWFSQDLEQARELPSFRRTHAHDAVAKECRAVREAVGLWETSSYCKIGITGPDAAEWLDGLVANRLPAVGRVSLCPMLTPQGRILGDVTVLRLADQNFLLMGSPAAESLYLRWFTSHGGSHDVLVASRTSTLCGFSVTGPAARELLSRVCHDDVSNAAFPFLHARQTIVGLAPAIAIRVSYTGELGYELYVSPEYQRHAYGVLLSAGKGLGLRHFGVRALNALRLEKGYGGWGREYTQDRTPAEAGLQRLVRTDKSSFVGRDAAITQFAGLTAMKLRLMAIYSGDPDPVGGEPVLHAGKPIARLTSAAFSHAFEYSLGFAYLPAGISSSDADLQVDMLGARVRARVLDAPPYDPSGARLRG
jgi:dimethylglycine dehydrogenase